MAELSFSMMYVCPGLYSLYFLPYRVVSSLQLLRLDRSSALPIPSSPVAHDHVCVAPEMCGSVFPENSSPHPRHPCAASPETRLSDHPGCLCFLRSSVPGDVGPGRVEALGVEVSLKYNKNSRTTGNVNGVCIFTQWLNKSCNFQIIIITNYYVTIIIIFESCIFAICLGSIVDKLMMCLHNNVYNSHYQTRLNNNNKNYNNTFHLHTPFKVP